MCIRDRSKDAWNALTEDQQKIIKECAKEAGQYEREEQRRQADEAMAELEKQGMKITKPDKQQFIDSSAQFRKEYGKVYQNIVDMIEAAR